MPPRVERAKSWETVRKTSGSGKRTATEKGADQVVNRVRYGSATPSAESSKAPRYEETTTAEKKKKMQELFAQLNKEGGSWHKTVFIKARSLYHKQQAGRELSPVEADFFRLDTSRLAAWPIPAVQRTMPLHKAAPLPPPQPGPVERLVSKVFGS